MNVILKFQGFLRIDFFPPSGVFLFEGLRGSRVGSLKVANSQSTKLKIAGSPSAALEA